MVCEEDKFKDAEEAVFITQSTALLFSDVLRVFPIAV
jgi:hypothetical protein